MRKRVDQFGRYGPDMNDEDMKGATSLKNVSSSEGDKYFGMWHKDYENMTYKEFNKMCYKDPTI